MILDQYGDKERTVEITSVASVLDVKAHIEAQSFNDDEGAHADQDALWLETLRAIAAGVLSGDEAQAAAAEAASVADIEFSRWYA